MLIPPSVTRTSPSPPLFLCVARSPHFCDRPGTPWRCDLMRGTSKLPDSRGGSLSAYISFGAARSPFHIRRRGSHDPATLAAVHTRTLNVSYFTSVFFFFFSFILISRNVEPSAFGGLLANYSSFDALGRRFPFQFDPLTALFRQGSAHSPLSFYNPVALCDTRRLSAASNKVCLHFEKRERERGSKRNPLTAAAGEVVIGLH